MITCRTLMIGVVTALAAHGWLHGAEQNRASEVISPEELVPKFKRYLHAKPVPHDIKVKLDAIFATPRARAIMKSDKLTSIKAFLKENGFQEMPENVGRDRYSHVLINSFLPGYVFKFGWNSSLLMHLGRIPFADYLQDFISKKNFNEKITLPKKWAYFVDDNTCIIVAQQVKGIDMETQLKTGRMSLSTEQRQVIDILTNEAYAEDMHGGNAISRGAHYNDVVIIDTEPRFMQRESLRVGYCKPLVDFVDKHIAAHRLSSGPEQNLQYARLIQLGASLGAVAGVLLAYYARPRTAVAAFITSAVALWHATSWARWLARKSV